MVAFFYVLLRDHLPAGKVETIIEEHIACNPTGESTMTNGFLGEYAEELVARLKQPTIK